MSRRHRAVKRVVHPDPKFGDKAVSKFMNYVMLDGRKEGEGAEFPKLESVSTLVRSAKSIYMLT